MKKLAYLFTLIAIISTPVCIAVPTTSATAPNTSNANGTTQTEPDYTVVSKNHENFYYDKYGKMIAHDKTLKTGTFFYNATGQFVGKSLLRGEKTYYYNSIGQFIGVCDIKGECQDKNFASTGKIPPLPMVKKDKPFFDDSFLNQQKSSDEEE